MKNNESLVSIIIIAYKKPDSLKRLLDSIYKSSYKNIEVVVVNNSSEDYKLRYEQIIKEFPHVIHCWNGKNLMISSAWNLGFDLSKGDMTLFSADDFIFEFSMLRYLVNSISKAENIGVVGPMMYYSNNEMHDPAYSISLSTGIPLLKRYKPGDNKVNLVDGVILISRKIMKEVGKFDEKNFNFYLETAEFCARVRQKGYICVVCFEARAWHDHLPLGGYILPDPDRYKFTKTYYYLLSTKVKYIRKHANALQKICFFSLFLWLLFIWHGGTILLLAKHKKKEKFFMLCKGIINGIFEKL